MSGYPDNDTLFDTQGQTEVLRLIARRSARYAADASRGLRSHSAAARQLRLDHLIPSALCDADANWSEVDGRRSSAT